MRIHVGDVMVAGGCLRSTRHGALDACTPADEERERHKSYLNVLHSHQTLSRVNTRGEFFYLHSKDACLAPVENVVGFRPGALGRRSSRKATCTTLTIDTDTTQLL